MDSTIQALNNWVQISCFLLSFWQENKWSWKALKGSCQSSVWLWQIFLIFPLDILGYSNGSIGAVTVTVIVIHVIMGFYIWVAIKEEEVTQQLKQD